MLRGFDGRDFESACRTWQRSAREFRAFADARAADEGRTWMTVRYEDVVRDLRAELARIFAFVDIPVEEYPFGEAERAPVIGSSFVEPGDDMPDWTPRERPEGFDSLRRWESWSAWQHARFCRLCGAESEMLGYDVEPSRSQGARLAGPRHVLADGKWWMMQRRRQLVNGLRRRLGGGRLG